MATRDGVSTVQRMDTGMGRGTPRHPRDRHRARWSPFPPRKCVRWSSSAPPRRSRGWHPPHARSASGVPSLHGPPRTSAASADRRRRGRRCTSTVKRAGAVVGGRPVPRGSETSSGVRLPWTRRTPGSEPEEDGVVELATMTPSPDPNPTPQQDAGRGAVPLHARRRERGPAIAAPSERKNKSPSEWGDAGLDSVLSERDPLLQV